MSHIVVTWIDFCRIWQSIHLLFDRVVHLLRRTSLEVSPPSFPDKESITCEYHIADNK